MDLAKIEQLADLVSRSRIAELDLTQDGTRIRILKNPAPGPLAGDLTAPASPGTADREYQEAHAATLETKPQPEASDVADVIVPAPMHGVFHQAAAPGAPPLVEVGASIEAGQNICVIEAMKTFIGVVAETPGTVVAILAENGDEIEAGQPLFRIRPAGTS
ncbi:acetyl-CoA carboxylase biotin carboxyl carrier protein subunit [Bradyrhizobium sp. AUGA SZCCT0431]|uniref:acetyl-CoA carboxylase biotin carboxyl carrier protein n=1 Tax=Bradyrhizobium sp. AUGA SZCCT0431 TaxID=2807674 RepID=UPI001BA58BA8|nr:acetyl-CoA carboxylase biotin carboxyl carrier protein subunit [Bradyrhizobium sp. AUGA SZCCT0431]MBR1142588.1 acetyl-CoA carboxylase biotin carboxyl carrier protein subunit [Bradyrhizobium sp. AUGA SZCCT0431]